jgi:hypothetical protein
MSHGLGFQLRSSIVPSSLFISAGMHYYVAGRYAVFAGLNPTAANLLHHAIEMALKGALAKKGMDLRALKRLSHAQTDARCAAG